MVACDVDAAGYLQFGLRCVLQRTRVWRAHCVVHSSPNPIAALMLVLVPSHPESHPRTPPRPFAPPTAAAHALRLAPCVFGVQLFCLLGQLGPEVALFGRWPFTEDCKEIRNVQVSCFGRALGAQSKLA
eukprot:2246936-Prymnesium_polylepis.2